MIKIRCILENHIHDEFPFMSWDAISCHVSHPWVSSALGTLWLVSCSGSPGLRRFSSLAYSSESSWILMSWLRTQWVPVAAGHCGKLAPSLIVIRRPSSVPIKIRKDDTYGGTCSSEYVCVMRWRAIEGERKSECICMYVWARVCVCAHIQGHKTTPLPWQPLPSEHMRLRPLDLRVWWSE